MKNKLFNIFVTFLFTLLFCSGILAQNDVLKLNQETKFVLKSKEKKVLFLNLKKGDFAEISWTDKFNNLTNFTMLSPGGEEVFETFYSENPLPFVAKEDGQYKLTIEAEESENNAENEVSIVYSNVFKLPKSAKVQRQKKINGYDIKVYNTSEAEQDGYGTYLLIEKNGKLMDIMKGGSLIANGFRFGDVSTDYDVSSNKKSANLMRTTIDKTGDGTPDIAVQFYTGGAHCCFDMHFYELGKDGVRKLKTISGGDSDIIPIGKTPKGGLILQTGDSTFAYWLTSFAGSPIPTVILTYQNGEFRPDAKLMKKPAPSLTILKQKAAKAKKEMDLTPYTGDEDSKFIYAFWGEMIDLMYSGNETAAWQYFDLVWDSRKPGKEIFKQDFLKRLNESEYWRMMQEGRR